jgi:hypothetical protein
MIAAPASGVWRVSLLPGPNVYLYGEAFADGGGQSGRRER